jgi:hypothetical protein
MVLKYLKGPKHKIFILRTANDLCFTVYGVTTINMHKKVTLKKARDIIQFFLLKYIVLGLTKNLCWFFNFSDGSLIR